MNELKIFQRKNFGELRVICKDGEAWFVASDICKALGISNTTDAVKRLDNDERARFNLGHPMFETNVINEPGFYSLVLRSRKPHAIEFKRWIVHEVIPSIRKTGAYFFFPKDYASALRTLADEIETRHREELENETQREITHSSTQKLLSYKTIHQNQDELTVSLIAAEYGLSAKRLNRILYDERVQYRLAGKWVLYKKYSGYGYTNNSTYFTKWTEKGRLFIKKILEDRGITEK